MASAPDLCTALHQALVLALRRMDAEADGLYPSTEAPGALARAGLRRYHEHYNRIHQKELDCETAWCRDLARLLRDQRLEARPEAHGRTAGVAVELPLGDGDALTVWVAVRGAWTVGFRATEGGMEPYVPAAEDDCLASARDTLAELAAEPPADARHVGLLLVGFDSPLRPLDPDVAALGPASAGGWEAAPAAEWEEPYWRTRARVWLWTRPQGP
jgi:hypothetical protein